MYKVLIGMNKRKYVKKETVGSVFHATDGNSKTGKHVGNYNLPIEYTCDHRCECYKKGLCYACQGCYLFADNQALYSENYNYYKTHSHIELADRITKYIKDNHLSLFRFFTCGDIPSEKFLQAMVKTAIDNPTVRFWAYTKKYHIVNDYLNKSGENAIPENLVIIFSHWMNDDGSYFPMNNPYNMPTSEFIPLGKEEEAEKVTHICPCSNPNVKATCATCDHPCYTLKRGESMALLEHSTKRTKTRDKAIKEAKAKL